MSSPWMSPALLWAMFLVLLALTLLASLRFDWLNVWWQDQLRQATGAEAAESAAGAEIAEVEVATRTAAKMPPKTTTTHPIADEARLRRRPEAPVPVSRTIQAARAPAHRSSGLWAHAITPHAGVQRTLFHRSGRRH